MKVMKGHNIPPFWFEKFDRVDGEWMGGNRSDPTTQSH
jgi:hypothetical protein